MPRVALIGYGAVAALHARRMLRRGEAEIVSVYGPDREKARRFATTHGIPVASDSLAAALESSDAAIICSPTTRHFEQACTALEAGVETLVELPACPTAGEARTLGELAGSRGVRLNCAHTSRYLAPYVRIREWLQAGALGAVTQVRYWRSVPPRERSWSDDALLHHAGHPLDLFLHWFGTLRTLGCAAQPLSGEIKDLAVLGELPGGAPASVSISYTARLADISMTVVGSEHTVVTDGFSFIRSDRRRDVLAGRCARTLRARH